MNVDTLISLLLQYDKYAEVFFNAEEDGYIFRVESVHDVDGVILTGEKL